MDSSITTDMETILESSFFSETIVHNYPTAQTENLTVQWFESESLVNEMIESLLPYFLIKTSDMTNIDRRNSEFVRNTETYKIHSMEPDKQAITRINVSKES